MTKEEIEDICKRSGWTLECFSPLEISHPKADHYHRASGWAAEIVLESLQDELLYEELAEEE